MISFTSLRRLLHRGLAPILIGLAVAFQCSANAQTVITRNCIVGATMEIGNLADIMPSAAYDRMDVLMTTVPGTSFGVMSKISVFAEETVWGTTGANNFAPAAAPSFNQNRVPRNNAFRYVNNGTGLGQSESIPVRFVDQDFGGQPAVNATLVINIVPVGTGPQIVTQPVPLQAVPPGTSATLTVVASGTAPLSYQWYEGFPPSTFSPVAGATQSSFVTPPVTAAGQYHYWVRVSNPVSSVNSNGATVNVGYPPDAHANGPYFAPELQTIQLNPTATDPDSVFIAYAWDFNGNSVFGEISSQFGPEGAISRFTANGVEGPGDVITITLRASDNTDQTDTDTTTVIIVNAPPRATFTSNGTGAVVTFSNFIDSPGDLGAGFTFGYDFNNDGTFEVTGSTAASAAVPANFLADYLNGVPVRGRITDRDGGSTDYLACVFGRGIVVTTLADESNSTAVYELGTAGISLREALALAEVTAGDDAIFFDPALLTAPGAQIAFASTMQVTTNVAICGPITGNGITLTAQPAALTAATRAFQVAPTGSLTLDRMTLTGFWHFAADARGGAILNEGNLRIRRSTLWGNFAQAYEFSGIAASGGAIYSLGGTVTLENSTVTGNDLRMAPAGTRRGGAIFAHGAAVTLTHVTISGNTGDTSRGLFLRSDGAATATAVINNSILGEATATVRDFEADAINGGATPVSSGVGNLVTSSLGFGGSSIGGNPGLGPLANNGGTTPTLSPVRGSLAVNRAAANVALPSDQRGFARPIARRYDIGAVEFDGFVESLVVTTAQDEDDATSDTLFGTGTSLREALFYAQSLGGTPTITFAPALHGQTVTLIEGATGVGDDTALRNGSDLTIDGGPGVTINLASPVPRRHFLHAGGTLNLRNLTFSGGDIRTVNDGGALLNTATVAITNVRFTNNRANHGGAVLNSGTMTIENSTFDNNATAAGGFGGAIWSNTSLSVAGTTFYLNSAGVLGGAIVSSNGLTVTGCNFSTNHSDFNGGAVRLDGTAAISSSTFSNNTATNGGGAIMSHGATTLTNVTIAYNTALDGGGIQFFDGVPTVQHATIAYNTATRSGGGIAVNFADVTVKNSLIAANTESSSIGSFNAASSNNLLNLTDTQAGLGAFANHGGSTHTIALLAGSPAINTGVTIAGLTTDQRGLARNVGGAPDIGALEDATGDDDPDRDSLTNFAEFQLTTNPLALDTDGDGFNDATEGVNGSDPKLAASAPGPTRIERVLGVGPARGLDFTGNFRYAVNVGTNNVAGAIGDATFTADTVAGVTVNAPFETSNWTSREFGSTAADDLLEDVFRSQRYSGPTPGMQVNAANLVPGRNYKLQLFFADAPAYVRLFDVTVNGTTIFAGFNTNTAQGANLKPYAASAIVHTFTTPSSTMQVALSAAAPGAFDPNPLLCGFTVEEIPTPAAAPLITPAPGTYTASVAVTIASTAQGATIRYTTDGSAPSETTGTIYTGPFTLNTSATVRAIAVSGGWLPSPITSATYTVRTSLEAWRALHGLAADGSQDLANPSRDGIANILKYAFNLAPNTGDLSTPNTTVLPANGTAGLPFFTRDTQGRLFIEFIRRKAATQPAVTYTVETGATLTTLQPLALTGATITSINANWERITLTDPTITPQRFGRVRVTTTP